MDPITLDELLNELNKHGCTLDQKTENDAKTVNELREEWDKSDAFVRTVLKKLSELGLLKVVRKTVKTIDGRTYRSPAYFFTIATDSKVRGGKANTKAKPRNNSKRN